MAQADVTQPLSQSDSVALVAVAATAYGFVEGRLISGWWLNAVRELAVDLSRVCADVSVRAGRVAVAKPITGVITGVEARSGRGVITMRPTMGKDEPEQLRTAWLREAHGRAMFDRAQSLVGRHCEFGKFLEATEDGQQAVRMCEWIDDLGPDPAASHGAVNATATQRRRTMAAQPASTPPVAASSSPVAASSSPPSIADMHNMRPNDMIELLDMAARHLNLDSTTVTGEAQRRWSVPAADLSPTQLTILWNHLINVRVAA